jgi:hypothetical protein
MKWEYLLRYLKYEDFRSFEEMSRQMSQLGEESWELVSVVPEVSTKTMGKPVTIGFAYYFKRPKQ